MNRVQTMVFDERILGSRIKEARQLQGLSQSVLGEALGYSQRDISQIENGNRLIRITELSDFAEALNVSILYLLEGNVEYDYFQTAIVEQINRLESDDDKNTIIEVVRLMCDAILR